MNKIFSTIIIALAVIVFSAVAYDFVEARQGKNNWLAQFMPQTAEELQAKLKRQVDESAQAQYALVSKDAGEKLAEIGVEKNALQQKIADENARYAALRLEEERDNSALDTEAEPYITPEEARYLAGNNNTNSELNSYLSTFGLGEGSTGGLDSLMGGLSL